MKSDYIARQIDQIYAAEITSDGADVRLKKESGDGELEYAGPVSTSR